MESISVLQIHPKSIPLVSGETRFMLPLLTKERVGVRFKELFTLIEMLPLDEVLHFI
jgi:hypothetical protein